MEAMSSISRKIVAPLVLASFLSVAFFGFAAMSYGADGNMQGDCPFSATGVVQCSQDALVAAMHHISAYQSFLNVPASSAALALIGALLLAAYLLVLYVRPLLFRIPVFISYNFRPLTSQDRKIHRWLSLHENSPSF